MKSTICDGSQLELAFDSKAASVDVLPCALATNVPEVRRLALYKVREGDRTFRRRVKQQRGCHCERCGFKALPEKILVHHILETRAYPEFAREALNIIVLCEHCHSEVTDSEQFGTSKLMLFYSKLDPEIRARHLAFLQRALPASSAIIMAFREGNWEYWNDRTVTDLCR